MSSHPVTVARIVRRAIVRSNERLVTYEAALRTGDDPESVHQARVATRRLRSDLRTFEDFVNAEWADGLRAELHWLGSELGLLRDLEVQRDRLRAHAGRLPPTEAESAGRVLRRLDADRAAVKSDLLAMLEERRYEDLRARLASAAESPAYTGAACAPAAGPLTHVVRRRWKQIRKAVDRLGDHPPDEALHAIRVRAKKARYAAEACAPALGKPARRFARAMANVQEILGEHHDAVVAIAWLAKTAHECSPAEAYAIGMLAEIECEAAAAARAAFPEAWRRADTKRARGWL